MVPKSGSWLFSCEDCGESRRLAGEELCARCKELLALRAKLADLQARLRAAQKRDGAICFSCGTQQTRAPHIYDLRCKNWRKL